MLDPLNARRPRWRGFTLIELLVAVAVAAILLTLAAPSLQDFIVTQRLKSINSQLVTDLQFARSEAVARNQWARFSFRSNDALTCYSIYTSVSGTTRCDCRNGAGNACTGTMREIRTVQFPRSDRVVVGPRSGIGQDTAFAFDHIAGGIVNIPQDTDSSPADSYVIEAAIDTSRVLRTTISRAGRPTVCAPASTALGAPAC
jgi:type IV fimbrial biogenesis protein FimT